MNEQLYYPIEQAPRGKCLSGALITCAVCGKQVFLTTHFMRNGGTGGPAHRWWEKIGWGKIGRGEMGRQLKGDLHCPDCHPAAVAEIAGVVENLSVV